MPVFVHCRISSLTDIISFEGINIKARGKQKKPPNPTESYISQAKSQRRFKHFD